MKITVYGTRYSLREKDIKDRIVVVIDVLRATSTIITALYNGCREVIPVSEIEEAVNISKNYEQDTFLLGGERNAQQIEGFHLSNSPKEYIPQEVEGKTVIITTTNGTGAIKKAAEGREVLLASFTNMTAICKYLMGLNEDIALLCAGTEGQFSMDDVMVAGAIIYNLSKENSELELDDLGMVAKHLYEYSKEDIHKALNETQHYSRLRDMGLQEDLKDCLQLDTSPIIPVYRDGIVKKIEDY